MRVFVLIVGLTVLLLGVVALGTSGWSLDEGHVVDEVERTFAASAREITINSLNGRVSYEPWEGDGIRIEATTRLSAPTRSWAERVGARVQVEMNESAGHVQAQAERTSVWGWFVRAAVQFKVYVPAEWAGTVTLTTSNGAITASHLRGGGTLHTSNGKITVVGSDGDLDVRTSNGRVELSGLHGRVNVRTSNGAVRLVDSVLSGGGRIRSSNGAITFEAGLTPDADYDVTTSNGSVTVELFDPDVSLHLSTSNGRIHLDTEVTVSRVERNRVEGRIGDGSARLNVRTSNGSITLDGKRSTWSDAQHAVVLAV